MSKKQRPERLVQSSIWNYFSRNEFGEIWTWSLFCFHEKLDRNNVMNKCNGAYVSQFVKRAHHLIIAILKITQNHLKITSKSLKISLKSLPIFKIQRILKIGSDFKEILSDFEVILR